jgi:DNA-binding MarR family transcriptional regulator
MSDEESSRPESDFELRGMVGHLLRVSQQVHAARWAEVFQNGMTSPQFAVLHVLAREDPVDQTTLRSRASLDRSTAADIIQRLVAKKWIVRTRDTTDTRRNLIRLTEEGRTVLRASLDHAREVNDGLLSGMEEHERQELLRLLGKVVGSPRQG